MPPHDSPDPGPPAQVASRVTWRLPSIHPDGRKFMVAGGALALVFWWVLGWDLLGWLTVGATVWIGMFFRDPVRTSPLGDRLILAPADGLVETITTVPPPRELWGADALPSDPVVRVSIYISPFDCHIIRAPIAGKLTRCAYVAGKFINPELDKASEDNERQHMLVEGPNGMRIGFTQIAGVVGRRIMTWVKADEPVAAGQRVGMIRFGSRTDVYLPAGTGSEVLLGQRTIAGETVIARLGEARVIEGVAQ